ncbi:MAG: FAD-dependent monooxygenase [Sphaerobacter sp.]|nr:FAD-dependent monooxygenase [Sphaerobacter sp.]
MRALIVGAGIGGLVTAHALTRCGLDVTVLEREPALHPAGAGIILWPPALVALGALGLAEPVEAAGSRLAWAETRTWRGGLLLRLPLAALSQRLGAPTIALHRAELQQALLGALDPATLRLGADFVRFDQDRASVRAHVADGVSACGDLLIGADGVRSTVRARLLLDGPPRYAGYTAWRGVTMGDVVPPDTTWELMGRGARFGAAPIGRGRIYWWATANVPAGEVDPPQGRKADLEARFAGWWAPVRELIASTPDAAILRHDILDRDPVDRWGIGRVTLLGDAAHPMTPNLGQGACQAIADAVALATALAREDDVVAALRAYEAARRARTARLTTQSRHFGQIGQWQHPVACWLRDLAFRLTPPRLALRQMEALLRPGP